MNASKRSPLSPTSDWQLEFARLIVFPVDPPFFVEQKWWEELASGQPEDFISTRRTDFHDERGSFQGALLSLTVDLRRVVWEVRSPRVVDRSGTFPTLGPFREKLSWFVDLLNPWLLSSCPLPIRLALSAKLLQPAATAELAYRNLAVHLPAVKLDPNPNDFVLQLNRRKPTSAVISGLPINRVSTWSKMNAPIFVEPGKPFTWPENCYSALELDINTAPEKTDVLARATLPALFRELQAIAVNIAEQGDIG